jgi:hypothetical protein
VPRPRIQQVDSVPHVRAQRTPIAEPPTLSVVDLEPARHDTHWGRPTPADALALRGLPAIGRGIGSGAIKGTQPGARL